MKTPIQFIPFKLEKHTRNKLTLAVDETRLKLSVDNCAEKNKRVIAFAKHIEQAIRRSYHTKTVRGEIVYFRDVFYITLRDGHKHLYAAFKEPNNTQE